MGFYELLRAQWDDYRQKSLWKDAPVTADVHVSNAGGTGKPKRKKPKEDDDGGHLPVTNMTLAAQQITGQGKITQKVMDDFEANCDRAAQRALERMRKDAEEFEAFREEFFAPAAEKFAQIIKVDDSLGLVFGWAIVCKKDGADYYDLQDDFIPEDSMLVATVDFMQSGAMAKEMHTGEGKGTVLFAFPLTEDIAKAFGLETKTTGLMVAMKPSNPDMLAKFKDGTYTGFSIGGYRLKDEDVT